MPVRPVLLYTKDEAKLRQVSEPVERISKPVKRLIQDLKDTLAEHPGAGLAAPQIDVHKRVTVVRFGQESGEMADPLVLINPEILEMGETKRSFDGCLSMPKIYTWDGQRPAWLRFRALGEDGQPIEMRVEGIDAALVHHEVDHLDGIFFLDRLAENATLYTEVQTEDGEVLVPLDDLIGLD